jgi:D-sedoheptulose 7-phosphate isomerase
MRDTIERSFRTSAEVLGRLVGLAPAVEQAARMVIESLRQGGKLMVCGNGGSAADSQHIAAELTGRFYTERTALAAIALTTNTSDLTAVANDMGYENVFSRQVEGLGRAGDVLIGISTSGNSENVVRALALARARAIRTIALTGAREGRVDPHADLVIKVPSTDTPRIQEGHIAIGHIICQLVEEAFLASVAEPAAARRGPG